MGHYDIRLERCSPLPLRLCQSDGVARHELERQDLADRVCACPLDEVDQDQGELLAGTADRGRGRRQRGREISHAEAAHAIVMADDGGIDADPESALAQRAVRAASPENRAAEEGGRAVSRRAAKASRKLAFWSKASSAGKNGAAGGANARLSNSTQPSWV